MVSGYTLTTFPNVIHATTTATRSKSNNKQQQQPGLYSIRNRDCAQSAHSLITGLAHEQTSILNTHNYLLPEGTGRGILDIPISERKPFILENGHTAYQIQLEALEPVLETSTYLLDRFTRQFHMVYNNGYRQMATTPMRLSTWHEGQLVDELEETCALFGLPPKEVPSPARQPAASQCLPPAVIQQSQSHALNTAENGEAVPDLNSQPPPPRTVEYIKPSFSLERPVCRLKMAERLEVHNNLSLLYLIKCIN